MDTNVWKDNNDTFWHDVEKQALYEQRNKRAMDKITEYLSNGGLFNPELMEHTKVRDLLIECRELLS